MNRAVPGGKIVGHDAGHYDGKGLGIKGRFDIKRVFPVKDVFMASPRIFRFLLLASASVLLGACGGTQAPPPKTEGDSAGSEKSPADTASSDESKPAEGEGDSAKAKEGAGEPSDVKSANKEVQAEPASEAAAMARDFLKTGGRRIGWSAQKKMFAYPAEQRSETGFGLDIQFVGEDGKPRDAMRICQIGECEEHLDELSKELLPKLTSRLENDGYVSIRGIGWPQGRDELEVSSLSMKLQYSKGTLSSLREGKPAARLSIQGGKRISADTLLAVFVIPDTKWLPAFAPPGKDAKGLTQEFFVFKLP